MLFNNRIKYQIYGYIFKRDRRRDHRSLNHRVHHSKTEHHSKPQHLSNHLDSHLMIYLLYIAVIIAGLIGCATAEDPQMSLGDPLNTGGVESIGGEEGGRDLNDPPEESGRPSLMRVGDKVAVVNQELTIQLRATDPQNDPLSFNLRSSLPDGAKFNKDVGVFTWIPTIEQEGESFLLTFEVSDGELKDQETIAVRVSSVEGAQNISPQLEPIGDQLLSVANVWSYQLVGTDPNGDALTYRITGALPADIQLDPLTGIVSWTPTVMSVGTHSLRAIVSDGELEASTDLRLIVREANQENNGNQPPRFVIVPQQEVEVGETIRLTIEAEDDQSQNLVFSADMLPESSHFDPMTRLFIWVPQERHANQSIHAFFQVSDGEFRDFMRVEFQVKPVIMMCPPDPDGMSTQAIPLEDNQILNQRVLCDETESDLYSITLSSEARVEIFSTFLHVQGDIDLFLFDTNMVEIGSSDGIEDEERIETNILSPGTYYIRVNLLNNGPSLYDIGYRVLTTGEGCLADELEGITGNNRIEDASPALLSERVSLSICAGDRDFFSFFVERGDQISVNSFFNGSIADLDMRLRAPNDGLPIEEIRWSALSSSSDELIEVNSAPVSGVYTLEVYVVGQNSIQYDLLIDVIPALPCETDRFENNDLPQTAVSLTPELYRELTSCADQDWYQTEISSDRNLIFYLTYDEGNSLIVAEDQSGQALEVNYELLPKTDGCLAERDLCLRAVISPPFSGGVIFYSITFNEVGVEYDLRIRTGDEVGATCQDDFGCNPGFVCLSTFDVYSFPAGVCSEPCQSENCGSNRACILDTFGTPMCMQRCDTGFVCRDPFVCEDQISTINSEQVSVCLSSEFYDEDG